MFLFKLSSPSEDNLTFYIDTHTENTVAQPITPDYTPISSFQSTLFAIVIKL